METTLQVQKYDWEYIFTDTYYQIATKLLDVYEKGEYDEIGKALHEMVKDSIIDARYELRMELKMLMENVLYSKYLPDGRTQDRWEKICRHRSEIETLMEYFPFLTKETILEFWPKMFEWAKELLETYLPNPEHPIELTEFEVFEAIF